MRKYVIVSVLCLVSLSAFAQDRVRILNNTGYTVYYVYVSQTAASSWEEDVLGSDVLMNGNYVDVRLGYPLTVTDRYDIRLRDSDGDTYTKWNVLITPNALVEFTLADLDGASSGLPNAPAVAGNQQIRIINNTGYTVYYVYVSQAASSSWGSDVMGSSVLMNGNYVDVPLPYPLTVTNRYDIKLVDSDGDSYNKWNVLITPNAVVEFTFSDYD
jgi:hypothetical protein